MTRPDLSFIPQLAVMAAGRGGGVWLGGGPQALTATRAAAAAPATTDLCTYLFMPILFLPGLFMLGSFIWAPINGTAALRPPSHRRLRNKHGTNLPAILLVHPMLVGEEPPSPPPAVGSPRRVPAVPGRPGAPHPAVAADHDGSRPEQRSTPPGPSISQSTAGRDPCQRSATASIPCAEGDPIGLDRVAAPGGWERGGEEVDDAGLLDGDAAERPGQVGEIAGGSDGHRLDVGPSGSRRGHVLHAAAVTGEAEDLAGGGQPRVDEPGDGSRTIPRQARQAVGRDGGSRPPTAPRPRPTGPARPRATRNGTGSSAAGGPSSRSRDRSVGRATAGDSGRRRSAPASVWRNQPRTTCSGFGSPDGSGPGAGAPGARATTTVERCPIGRTRASGGASPPWAGTVAGRCEVSRSLRLRATAIGAGDRFSSATTASPPPSATAYAVWTASPPGYADGRLHDGDAAPPGAGGTSPHGPACASGRPRPPTSRGAPTRPRRSARRPASPGSATSRRRCR